ncbi:hypothetical protein [Brevibacillus sp. H7]|uniref:hypothetical protein n=1 Tax=Brevibacillus sp. H7 TaxID=3349138 RepID=UPI0037FB482D
MGKKMMNYTVQKTRPAVAPSLFEKEAVRVQAWTQKAGISNDQMNKHLKDVLNKFRNRKNP